MNDTQAVVISGYYGFANAGDEAMLAAMIEALTDLEPTIKITVISGDPADTKKRHGVDAVYRLNYLDIMRVLAKSQLLISGGGSLLQDVTSDRSLYYYLSIMMLAKKMGTPVMLYAQGIGPVKGSLAKAAMRYIGNMVDLITVRDEGSHEELKRLQVSKPPIYVTADPVLAMRHVNKEIGRAILWNNGLAGDTPLLGISVREWKEWAYYKDVLVETIDQIVKEFDARVVFIPMQWPEDFEVSRKIASRLKTKVTVLEGEFTTAELLSLTGNLDILLGIRLHALIFAAVMHVPMVGISYDPKIDRFLETLGEKPIGNLKNVTAAGLVARIGTLWPEINQPNSKREQHINALHEKAFSNAELALTLLTRK